MLAEDTDDWTLSWRQEGKAEGLAEGLAKGRKEGEAALLKRLLTLRFGPLPEWADHRLEEAPTEDLERWGERILEAETLEQIFSE